MKKKQAMLSFSATLLKACAKVLAFGGDTLASGLHALNPDIVEFSWNIFPPKSKIVKWGHTF